VERFITDGTEQTRLSLYDSRVVVISIRRGDQRTFFRSMLLEEEEYATLMVAITQSSGGLPPDQSFTRTIDGLPAQAEVILYAGQPQPLRIRYSPMVSLDLSLAQLVAALDDLQGMVSAVGPYHRQLQTWQPKKGDLVELLNGRRARVIRVQDTGVLVLEHENSPLLDVVAMESITQVIHRVITEEEEP
jgi:hypothetical protein